MNEIIGFTHFTGLSILEKKNQKIPFLINPLIILIFLDVFWIFLSIILSKIFKIAESHLISPLSLSLVILMLIISYGDLGILTLGVALLKGL